MKLELLTGTDVTESFLAKVLDIDKKVYDPKYAGELDKMVARYQKNPKTFEASSECVSV